MKMRATLVWEYDLPETDLQDIKDSDEGGDPTDDYIEMIEGEFYENDPITYLEKRLLTSDDMGESLLREGVIHAGLNTDSLIGEHLSQDLDIHTKLKVEVIDHAGSRRD